MKAIKIISKCAASGQHLSEGKVFKVPDQVSEEDAVRLVRMGRAEEAEPKSGKAEPKAQADSNDPVAVQ